jgi:hypothetical protein
MKLCSRNRIEEKTLYFKDLNLSAVRERRLKLKAAADYVLGLREHEREIPVEAYLTELERVRREFWT